MRRFLLTLLVAVALCACGKDDGNGGGGATFTPPAQEEREQSAYADEETTGGGFTFTAATSWRATVTEQQPVAGKSVSSSAADGNNVVWLRLYDGTKESYQGGAGKVTLRIEVDENYTGERRAATVSIRSGSNRFDVSVVQEATKEDGGQNEAPVKVTGIVLNMAEATLSVGETVGLTAAVAPADATIKSVVWSSSNPDVASVHPVTGVVSAIADGEAVITATSSSNKEVSASCTVTVGDGEVVGPAPGDDILPRKVSSIRIHAKSYKEEIDTFDFTYDEDGRIIRVDCKDYWDDAHTTDYTYTANSIKALGVGWYDGDETFTLDGGRMTAYVKNTESKVEYEKDMGLTETTGIVYDAGGYMTSFAGKYTDSNYPNKSTFNSNIVVNDGSWTQYGFEENSTYSNEDGTVSNYKTEYTIDFKPGNRLNNLNVDLFGVSHCWLNEDMMLAPALMLGVGGNRSKYLPESFSVRGISEYDGELGKSEDFDATVVYRMDGDYISGFTVTIDWRDGDTFDIDVEITYEK